LAPGSWRCAGSSSRRASACRPAMDYLIAIAAAGMLFAYLIVALLHPERF
jgi:K+-transporting ATPase KdpF subunit